MMPTMMRTLIAVGSIDGSLIFELEEDINYCNY